MSIIEQALERFEKKFPMLLIDKAAYEQLSIERGCEEMLDDKLFYWLGYRDALAGVLAETKDKIKLPDLAIQYEKLAKEKHFSHQWHTNPN
jgi:hypothetical protein